MIEFNINQPAQRSIDWFRARLGHFTGSNIVKLMGCGRKKDEIFSATAISYIYQVASERMLADGVVNDDDALCEYIEQVSHTNRAMQFGIDNEDKARTLYELITGNSVTELSSV